MDRRAFLRSSALLLGTAAGGLVVDAWANQAAAQSLGDFLKSNRNKGGALFGSTEISSASLEALPQWARVLRKMREERGSFRACIDSAEACTTAGLKSWREVSMAAKGKPRLTMLKTVNRYFNRWPYKIDQQLYGVSEFWATPRSS